MIDKEDPWILQEIFQLSDHALVRLLNRLFDTHYTEKNQIWKEWQNEDRLTVTLRVDGVNRYEFRLRRLDGCLQICAQDKGYDYFLLGTL